MNLLMTLLCVLILGVGVVFGLIRRSNRSLVRLATLLLAAGGAFCIARFGVGRVADLALEYAKGNLIADAAILTYIESNPELVESLVALVRTLVAPLLFWACYMFLKPLTWILYKLICWAFRIKGPKLHGFGRLAGACVGLLCGAVGVVVLVVPICGYGNLAAELVDGLNLPEDHEVVAYAHMAASLKNAPVAALAYNTVGDPLFDSLSTAEVGDSKAVLSDELNAMTDLVSQASVLTKSPIDSFNQEQVQAVEHMAQDVGNSKVLSNVGSAIFASAARTWLDGGAFLGVQKPEMGEDADIIIGGMLEVLSTSDADNIGEDLGCVADIFEVMVSHEIFPLLASGMDTNQLTAKLAADGVLEDLYAVLENNPRMKPFRDAFADVGVKVMMQQLGLPADLKESHGEMLSDMSVALKNAVDANDQIDGTVLETEVKGVMQSHNIAVDDSAVKLVSEGIAQEFTGEELKTLTEQQIIDRLAERFAKQAGTK